MGCMTRVIIKKEVTYIQMYFEPFCKVFGARLFQCTRQPLTLVARRLSALHEAQMCVFFIFVCCNKGIEW